MKISRIQIAKEEAERFIHAYNAWKAVVMPRLQDEEKKKIFEMDHSFGSWNGKEHAALKRASLDLSRALSTMRTDK